MNKKIFFVLIVFPVGYMLLSVYYEMNNIGNGYNETPVLAVAIIAVFLAIILFPGKKNDNIKKFLKASSDENIILIGYIYLLSGAFSNIVAEIGSVDAVVKLGIGIMPKEYLPIAIFVIACVLSFAMGSSMGTITTVAPIAISIAHTTDGNIFILSACVIGGAMFGDNLSFISDTTIAATNTMNVKMRDKFIYNAPLAFISALIVVILLFFTIDNTTIIQNYNEFSKTTKIVPYIIIIVLALLQVDVLLTLFSGIVCAIVLGGILYDIEINNLIKCTINGAEGMFEIFLLSFLINGIANMAKEYGVVDLIVNNLYMRIRSPKFAQLFLMVVVGIADAMTANNTISILLCGELALNMAQKYSIKPQKVASLIDISSCIVQGIIPYGMQLIVMCQLANINPVRIMKYMWYPQVLAIITIISILFSRNKMWKEIK